MSNELKPCPFCGSNDLITSLGPAAHNDGSEMVMCNQCESEANFKTWNTRAQPIVSGLVPDGWKLVPIEPTAAQCFTAAFNLCNEFGDEFVRDNKRFALAAYRWLVAASPSTKEGE